MTEALTQQNRLVPSARGKLVATGWFVTFLATFAVARSVSSEWIAIVSCVVLGCSYLLVRRTSRPFDLHRATITSFWYLTYLAMIFFPAFLVYADQEGPDRARYLFAVESVLITVPLGWLLASRLLRFREEETERYFQQSLCEFRATPRFWKVYLCLLCVAVIFTLLYIRQSEIIPLVYLLKDSGEYLELALLREESFKLLDSPFTYAYYLLRAVLYPFLIIVSLGCYLQTRQKRWLSLFGLTLVAGVLYASLSLAKAPVAAIFVVLGLFLYFFRKRRVKVRVMAAILVAVFLFPVAVILSVSSEMEVGPWDAFRGIAARLFYLPAEVVYYYFEVFPSHVGYLHGRSIDKFARLMGSGYFDTPNYVGQYAFPESLGTISANAAFIGDLNADFGLTGVLLGGILAGAIMQAMHVYVVRRTKTIVSLACYAFLVFAFWYLHSTSLPVVLASNGALLVLILAWLFGSVVGARQEYRQISELGRAQLAQQP